MTDRATGRWMVAPAALLLAGVAIYPLVATAVLSLQRLILVVHERRFIGVGNFAFLIRDGRFWAALGNTVYFAVVSVAVEIVLGLALAMLLRTGAPARRLLITAVLLPWAIPTVVASKTWTWLLNPDFGAAARWLGSTSDWLGTPRSALHAAILVDVWKSTPFVTLLLLAGLESIPGDLYVAARLDGASPVTMFWRITVPLLRPMLAVAVVFRLLDALRVFDVVYVLTGGGPANTTETLSIYAYKTLLRAGDFGYGSTLAVATFVIVAVFAGAYLRLTSRAGYPS